MWARYTLLVMCASLAVAQPVPGPRFEVASVRPAGPQHAASSIYRTGPGSDDPQHIQIERASLLRLINLAYGVGFDQIARPKWIADEYYSVRATVPPGATTDEVRRMWQRLLAERFHLKVHLASKAFDAYELAVLKTGPKFRESAVAVAPTQRWSVSVSPPRNVRLTFRDSTMTELAALLANPLGEPGASSWEGYLSQARVSDSTGLNGRYDFTLDFAGAWRPGGAFLPAALGVDPDTAPDLFGALIQQLGLQLKRMKLKLDVVAVDQAEQVPVEN